MKNKIFTKQFLDKLEQESKKIDWLNFIMGSFNLSFHDAILKIANHLKMEPEYFDDKAYETEKVSKNSDASTTCCERSKNLNFSNPSQDISRTNM